MINYCADKIEVINSVKEKCSILRTIEEKIRNSAAHEIVSINEEFFSKQIGINSAKVIQIMKEIFEFIFDKHRKNFEWDSYDIMGEHIIRKMKEGH